MTASQIINNVRTILDDTSTTVFYNDVNNLYPLLNSAQNQAITICLAKERAKRSSQESALEPLIKLQTASLTAGVDEYILSSDWMHVQAVQSKFSSSARISNTTIYPATFIGYYDFIFRERNSYLAGDNGQEVYTITKSGTTDVIKLSPKPSLSSDINGLQIRYYCYPESITGSGSNVTLKPSTHEALVYLTVSEALTKEEGRSQEAMMYYQKGFNILNTL